MKLGFIIFAVIFLSASTAIADPSKAIFSCTLDDHIDDKTLVLNQIFKGQLILDQNNKTDSAFHIPTFKAPTLDNREYSMTFRYIGKVGNENRDIDPRDLFQVSLYSEEKQIYSSSIGIATDVHYTSFINPDGTILSATCYVHKL